MRIFYVESQCTTLPPPTTRCECLFEYVLNARSISKYNRSEVGKQRQLNVISYFDIFQLISQEYFKNFVKNL